MNFRTGIVLGFVSFFMLLIMTACSTTRVDVGHVGLKVKLAGSDRGVQDIQIRTGWVFYNPLTEQIVQFPTNVQNIILTKDPHEGASKEDEGKADHTADESITFSSVEGVNANADVGFSFHIDPMQAPKLYVRFRQVDMRELAYGYMRNVIRQAFNDVSSNMPIQDMYGAKKPQMELAVNQKVAEKLGKDGVIIDQLTINGALRLPPNVTDAINNAIAATQAAIQSENKVRQIKAEADQVIAAAHGAAEAARQKAQGEADALTINTKAKAEALAVSSAAESKANKTIQESLTQQIIQYKGVSNWDGKLPTYLGSSGPIPMIHIN